MSTIIEKSLAYQIDKYLKPEACHYKLSNWVSEKKKKKKKRV